MSGKINSSNSHFNNLSEGGNVGGTQGVGDIVFNIKNKSEKITPKQIKEIAAKLAKVAYSMGETNDEESYAEWMEEDISEALKKVKRKREEQKKKKK